MRQQAFPGDITEAQRDLLHRMVTHAGLPPSSLEDGPKHVQRSAAERVRGPPGVSGGMPEAPYGARPSLAADRPGGRASPPSRTAPTRATRQERMGSSSTSATESDEVARAPCREGVVLRTAAAGAEDEWG